MIAPGILSRPNRHEAIPALRIGHRVAAAAEVRIERRIVLVALVQVASRGISLPDFYKRVANRPAIFVEHPPAQDNALADRLESLGDE